MFDFLEGLKGSVELDGKFNLLLRQQGQDP